MPESKRPEAVDHATYRAMLQSADPPMLGDYTRKLVRVAPTVWRVEWTLTDRKWQGWAVPD